MRVSLILLSVLVLPLAHALIIDEAAVLDPALTSAVEEFNGRSAIPLTIITTPATYRANCRSDSTLVAGRNTSKLPEC